MIWPFSILKKIVYFETCFAKIWANLAIFLDYFTLNLVILNNFWSQFGLYFIFGDLSLFDIRPIKFFAPCNPVAKRPFTGCTISFVTIVTNVVIRQKLWFTNTTCTHLPIYQQQVLSSFFRSLNSLQINVGDIILYFLQLEKKWHLYFL